MSDKKIAAELGVSVREVRKALKKFVSNKRPGVRSAQSKLPGESGPPGPPNLPARALARIAGFIDHRVFVWICLAVLCVPVGYMAMLPINNTDFPWHVAMGRYVVENHTVPTTEPFTHTARDAPMVAHEWLSQVIYYLVIEVVDILGLRWLHAALVLAVLVILFLWLRRSGVTPALALLGTFLYMVIAQGRFHPRPHMFDLLFLILMYGYVFVMKPALNWRQLLAIFGATMVWVNMHSGAILFATLVVIYFSVEVVQQKTGWRKPQPDDLGGGSLRRLGVLAVVVVAALIITPNHFRLFPYVLESKAINTDLSREWVSIAKYSPGDSIMHPFSVETFWIMAVATLVTAVVSIRRHSLSHLAIVLFLAYLPLTGQRFVAVYFAPILFVFAAFGRWAQAKIGDAVPPWRLVGHRLSSVLAIVVVGAALHPALNYQNKLYRYKGRLTPKWNFQPAVFPMGAVAFLEEVDLEGKLFNSAAWGGYILLRTYDKYPIFLDGRWVTVGRKIVNDGSTIANRRAGAFEKLDEYDINILLVPRGWMTEKLQEQRGWIPIFENYNAGLYLRDGPAAAANLQRCAQYYEANGIPFGEQNGFHEYAAYKANREWAKQFRIRRRHLSMGSRKMIAGW